MSKRKVDLIVIHCTATKDTVHYSREQLEKDHRARGFSKGGYHVFIEADGTAHQLREFDEVGAHVAGHNSHSIGICYEGGLNSQGKPKDTRTQDQRKELLYWIERAIEYGEGNVKRIVGHRDLSPDTNGNGVVEEHEWVKVCPCFDAGPEYQHLINEQKIS